MYANFELYSGGWVTADIKRKRVRSTTGCLPCRKQKKKCDESWPVCGSCVKRNTSSSCYHDSPRSPSTCPLTASPPLPKRVKLDQESLGLSKGSPQRSFSPDTSDEVSIETKTIHPIPRSPFTSVPGATVPIPPCSLPALFHVFDPAAHGLDPRPDSSIITLTAPLATRSPAVFHAMTACSSIFLAQKLSPWHKVAIQHHCEAVRHLAGEMNEQRLNDPDAVVYCMAVIMMLHLFEKFDASSRTASHLHVSAAQEVFFKSYARRPPMSILGALILEAYIFHIALNSTFHTESLKGYDHLETPAEMLTASAISQDASTAVYRRSLWLELPPDLLACIYKISFLRRQAPLTKPQWVEVAAINTRLEHFASLQSADSLPQDSGLSNTIYYVRQLYIAAARLVLWKLMDPDLNASDPGVQNLLIAALRDLVTLNPKSPLLLYPLAVLGTAATDETHRELITCQLIRVRHFAGQRGVGSVLTFLSTSWNSADRTIMQDRTSLQPQSSQLDVWLDESLLQSVVI